MNLNDWMMAIGGLGLLLLGMTLLTDGLKTAAGDRLQGFLERGTASPARAALSGFLVTALVQSSSAVVVALLGFTNAGMLKLRQAAWVVFGSNVGTTMTAWLVALVGLQLNIGRFAWPLIGFGMLTRLLRPQQRSAAIGLAVVGFGLLLIGIETLNVSFRQLVTVVPAAWFQVAGPGGLLLALLVGLLLTSLVQSSSAAIAILLSAASSGLFSPLAAAAVVMGANIGTATTAVLASIGATVNAKRLAMVHVLMNAVTAGVALLLILPLWWLAEWLAAVDGHADLGTALAAFHTVFNLLGLLLMAVLAGRLIAFAEGYFKSPELRSAEPRYLDQTVLQLPSMGINALYQEQKRVFKQYILRLRALLSDGKTDLDAAGLAVADANFASGELLNTISQFARRLDQLPLTGAEAVTLADLHAMRYRLVDLHQLVESLEQLPAEPLSEALQNALLQLLHHSQLKALSGTERQQLLGQIALLRQQQRQQLMQQLNDGQMRAAEVTAQLQRVNLWWRSAELLIACANVAYPVVD